MAKPIPRQQTDTPLDAEDLRAWMKAMGLSVNQLSKRLGISSKQLTRYRRGHAAMPLQTYLALLTIERRELSRQRHARVAEEQQEKAEQETRQ